jgi:hypothetical protein
MPTTIGVLFVVSILVAGVFMDAAQVSGSSERDKYSKQALAAAEAGLHAAAFRLNKTRPAKTHCLTMIPPAVPVGGECPTSPSESLGNGASFTYNVTPQLPAAVGGVEPCALLPTSTAPAYSSLHCITATGVAHGVKRRLQVRVAVPRGAIFAQAGLIGLDSVTLVNSITVGSDVGSNGVISGGSVNGTLEIGPLSPAPSGGRPYVRNDTPWELPQVDFTASAATNNNASISSTYYKTNSPLGRRLLMGSGSLTLSSGTYNFCDLYLDDGVNLKIASGAKVKIYIDSPLRDPSCGTGTGRFCLDNSITFGNASAAHNLEVYVYGVGTTSRCRYGASPYAFDGTSTPSSMTAHIVFNNSVNFNGTLYAPNSEIRANNSVEIVGALAGKSVYFGNSIEMLWPQALRENDGATTPVSTAAWIECRSTPTVPSDPESGCQQ